MHQYIEAPNYISIKNDISIFLAGGISGCENWQKHVAEKLSNLDYATVVNPRRDDWKVDKDEVKESARQIKWEFEYIRKTTDILFWFTDDTLQPISLYELGAALERNKCYQNEIGQRIFLGSDKNYKRVLDLKIQAKLVGYKWEIRDDLDTLIKDTVTYLKDLRYQSNRIS